MSSSNRVGLGIGALSLGLVLAMLWIAPARCAGISRVPQATDEWTVFTASADTRKVYVSSSTGNDSKDGLSPANAKRTIAAGKKLLRNSYPDWLLLKKGDSWDESFGIWVLAGRSKTERMLLSSYGTGTARPLLRTGTENGITVGDGAPNHVAIVGLHFWAHTYTGSEAQPKGVNWLNSSANFLLEDCCVQGYETNVVVMGFPQPLRHSNVVIRRNVIVDAYNTASSNSEGLFLADTDGLLIEQNVLDRNGWNVDRPGSNPTWFRRNVYIQNGCTEVTLRENIIASTDGVMLRPGGDVVDNLFLRNAISLVFGGGNFPELPGIRGAIRDNVMLDVGDLGSDGPAQGPRGWGITMENVAEVTIERNIMAHNTRGHDPIGMRFSYANGWSGNTRGVENARILGNIAYDWGVPFQFRGSLAQTVKILLQDGVVQNMATTGPLVVHENPDSAKGVTTARNTFYAHGTPSDHWMRAGNSNLSLAAWRALVQDVGSTSQQARFPDPARTIEKYQASLKGAPTFEAFLAEARKQSKDNWRVEYTARAVNTYIRAGFGR